MSRGSETQSGDGGGLCWQDCPHRSPWSWPVGSVLGLPTGPPQSLWLRVGRGCRGLTFKCCVSSESQRSSQDRHTDPTAFLGFAPALHFCSVELLCLT